MSIVKTLRTSRMVTRVKRAIIRPLITLQLGKSPSSPKGTVVFAGLTKKQLHVPGKMSPAKFLPGFCNALRSAGYHTFFACSEAELAKIQDCQRPVIVVMLYGEDDNNGVPESPSLFELLCNTELVFNHPHIGSVIHNKRRANEVLANAGVPMPELKIVADKPVFSNSNASSGEMVKVIQAGEQLDRDRYNTEFIDTRQRVDGKEYYTSVRLMCVGPYVANAFVRARDVAEGNPRVHMKDTPRDPVLIRALERRLIEPNGAEFSGLAERVYNALGPGFYAHDVLVEAESNRVFMCETNFKFNDGSFEEWVEAVKTRLSYWNSRYTAEHAALAALGPFLQIVSAKTARDHVE